MPFTASTKRVNIILFLYLQTNIGNIWGMTQRSPCVDEQKPLGCLRLINFRITESFHCGFVQRVISQLGHHNLHQSAALRNIYSTGQKKTRIYLHSGRFRIPREFRWVIREAELSIKSLSIIEVSNIVGSTIKPCCAPSQFISEITWSIAKISAESLKRIKYFYNVSNYLYG